MLSFSTVFRGADGLLLVLSRCPCVQSTKPEVRKERKKKKKKEEIKAKKKGERNVSNDWPADAGDKRPQWEFAGTVCDNCSITRPVGPVCLGKRDCFKKKKKNVIGGKSNKLEVVYDECDCSDNGGFLTGDVREKKPSVMAFQQRNCG